MSAQTAEALGTARPSALAWAGRQRVMIALVLLIVFGALRYDHFLGAYNVLERAALQFDVRADQPRHGLRHHDRRHRSLGWDDGGLAPASSPRCSRRWASFLGSSAGLGAGLAVGLINGFMVTRMKILPFIATLSGMLVASGTGLLLAHNQSVSVSYDTDFTWLGQGDFLGFPVPAWIAGVAYVYGSVVLNYTSFGRYVLAIGGNEEAARLMGLPVDRVTFWTYVQSSIFASLAGVILAAQFGAGQPAEGVGWELFSIAAVVVGGTLLTGGVGSVATTLAGVLLARPHLQRAQFRERPRLDQPQRLLAVGGARRLSDGGRHGELRRRAPRRAGGLG